MRADDISAEQDKTIELLEQTLKGRLDRVALRYHKKKDGSIFPAEITVGKFNQAGRTLLFGFIRDITERVEHEQKLRDSQERFHRLAEASFEGIVISEKGIILDSNDQFADMVKCDLKELIGKKVIQFVAPESRDLVLENIQKGFEGPYEHIALKKDGTRFPVEIHDKSIPFEGRIVKVTAIYDLTQRKEAEEALKNAMAEVERLKNRFQAEKLYLQEEIKLEHNFYEIVSQSDKLKSELQKIEQVAPMNTRVLILGETGTGKELFARAIHSISNRKDRPLVKVNCPALPPGLIESELFGHEKGAFTSAVSRKIGRFELADKGTIFLDEIGDLSLELQSKLLRVLQEGEFERLGSSQTIKVDVRIIAATNRNLENAVETGKFRADLYYRLNVFPINIPPLRERKEDIPLLIKHFVSKYTRQMGKKIDNIPLAVVNTLQDYHWPGNVRGLENIIERSVITCQKNRLELSEWLPKAKPSADSYGIRTLQEVEKNHILTALRFADWRVSGHNGAAKILDINSKTLESRMRKLGIKRSLQ